MQYTELAWDQPPAAIIEANILPEHIDGLGHTNNCEYLKWCEQVAWAHSESLGLGLNVFQARGVGMAAVRTELDYCAASYQGQSLAVATWLVACDGKFTMHRAYQIIRIDDGVTLLRGKTRFACIDMETGKLKRMPPDFIAAYSPV